MARVGERFARWRPALAALLVSGVLFATGTAGAVQLGRHVTDAKYAISFNLPSSWRSAVVSTTNAAVGKVKVFEPHIDHSDGLIGVDVVAGRQLSSAKLASALGATSGITVLGSKLVTSHIGTVEQLRFSTREASVLVYGTIDGFYWTGNTCYVEFESPLRRVAVGAMTVVMGTWGQ